MGGATGFENLPQKRWELFFGKVICATVRRNKIDRSFLRLNAVEEASTEADPTRRISSGDIGHRDGRAEVPVLPGEGGGFAEGAAEEKENVELINENGHEEQAGGEVDSVGPVAVGGDVEKGPHAEGEDHGDHGDAGGAEESGLGSAGGEGRWVR